MFNNVLKQINIQELIYSFICAICTITLFFPFYLFDWIPESNATFILMWLLLTNIPFMIIVSVFKEGKMHLSKKSKKTSFVILNCIFVIIAAIVLNTSDNPNGSLEIFFIFIGLQTFIGSIIK